MKYKKLVMILVGLGVAIVLMLGSMIVFGGFQQASQQACQTTTTNFAPVSANVGIAPQFNHPDQKQNAQTIIGIGLARHFSLRDIKIALMVAMQESSLRNLPYGDRDSLGIFQQRPSVGAWGTAAQIMDPVHATNAFYDHLVKIASRDQRSLVDVAIAVQNPNPTLYRATFNNWSASADAFLASVSPNMSSSNTSVAPINANCASVLGSSQMAIQAALTYQGQPYGWSDGSSCCQSLTQNAYAQAGVHLPNTVADQYKFGRILTPPSSQTIVDWVAILQPGDLLFWGIPPSRTDGTGAMRVALYVGNGQMIDAPDSSSVVSMRSITLTNGGYGFYGATRPLDVAQPAAANSGWQWPVKNTQVTSPFGMRFHPILHVWKLHDGTDFNAPMGTSVYAAHAGIVKYVGWYGGGGNAIVIDHGGGIETAYEHLSSFLSTKVGDHVTGGQLIALSGNTGYSTGPHLHFTVMVNGVATDPVPFMRKFGLVP